MARKKNADLSNVAESGMPPRADAEQDVRLQTLRERSERRRLAGKPEILDGARSPGSPAMPEPGLDAPPAWLAAKFKHPERVVIFRALKNRGLLLSLKEAEITWDAKGNQHEKGGLIVNFAKTQGWFATDDPETIELIKHAEGYGIEFVDVKEIKAKAQEENFTAFAADVADNPKLLERLVQENPNLVRAALRRLGKQEGDEFEDLETLLPAKEG